MRPKSKVKNLVLADLAEGELFRFKINGVICSTDFVYLRPGPIGYVIVRNLRDGKNYVRSSWLSVVLPPFPDATQPPLF